jgi:hypothetical protein
VTREYKTKKYHMIIKATIEPNFFDKDQGYNSRGRVTFKISLIILGMDETNSYQVTVMHTHLIDPEEGTLNDTTKAKAKDIPVRNGRGVTFDVDLGSGLQEKIEKCRSQELVFEFKIGLQVKQNYTMNDLFLPSYKDPYLNIESTNN